MNTCDACLACMGRHGGRSELAGASSSMTFHRDVTGRSGRWIGRGVGRGSDEARHFCKVRYSERVPHLLPFLSVGVGPYVIWETTESTDEEFDLKLHNRSCLILRNSNSTRERQESYQRSISDRGWLGAAMLCAAILILIFFIPFFPTKPHDSAAMLCAVLQLHLSWTWVPAYFLTGSIMLFIFLIQNFLSYHFYL